MNKRFPKKIYIAFDIDDQGRRIPGETVSSARLPPNVPPHLRDFLVSSMLSETPWIEINTRSAGDANYYFRRGSRKYDKVLVSERTAKPTRQLTYIQE